MIQEHERPIAVAERNAAEQEYFAQIPLFETRRLDEQALSILFFRKGFDQGWGRRAAHGVSLVKEIADLRAANERLIGQVARLRGALIGYTKTDDPDLLERMRRDSIRWEMHECTESCSALLETQP